MIALEDIDSIVKRDLRSLISWLRNIVPDVLVFIWFFTFFGVYFVGVYALLFFDSWLIFILLTLFLFIQFVGLFFFISFFRGDF